MEPPDELAAAIREGCGWLAAGLTDLAEGQEGGWRGAGMLQIAGALDRIGQALERQAAALERVATALGEGSKKGK